VPLRPLTAGPEIAASTLRNASLGEGGIGGDLSSRFVSVQKSYA
jgi:hypothetical protein